MNDLILEAREARSNLIKSKLLEYNVIIIKANIVGDNKNIYFSRIIINVFLKKLEEIVNIERYSSYESMDGPFILIETLDNPVSIKQKLIELENNHLLGRLVDLDVYSKNKILSRRDFGEGFRKCLICNDSAIICMRLNKHTNSELTIKSETIFRNYLEIKIKELVDIAITKEALLHPKFGLVTKYSKGSHNDMDFELLMKAKNSIIDDLVRMFFLGFDNDLLDGFSKARHLGLSTEEKMYQATANVNVYKGLIFILGIILVTIGYSIKNKRTDLSSLIQVIGKDLINELKNELGTFGKLAYDKYGFLGARGEVHNGLNSVIEAKNLITDFSDEVLTNALIYLIKNIDDTVLLKRSRTIEKYNYYKNLISNIKDYDLEKITKISSECINDNISFGGSADLLATSIFLKLIEKEMGIVYE